jgi:hypothetical protein
MRRIIFWPEGERDYLSESMRWPVARHARGTARQVIAFEAGADHPGVLEPGAPDSASEVSPHRPTAVTEKVRL